MVNAGEVKLAVILTNSLSFKQPYLGLVAVVTFFMSAVIGDIITPCYCHTWRCFWRRRSGCVHTITIGDAWVPNSDRCWWPLCGIIEGTCVIIFCLSKCLTFDIWCCTFWNFGNWWCTFWQKCLFRVTITNRYTLSISSTITRSYFTSCAWSCRRGFCWRQW